VTRVLLLGAASAVGLFAQTDPSGRGPLNQHLPKWMTVEIGNRARFEYLGDTLYTAGIGDGLLLNRLYPSMEVSPHKYFKVFAEGQDSRGWGGDPEYPHGAYYDRFDLRQSYVTVGDDAKGLWDLKLGRQELVYGHERILGVNRWVNIPRTFDAVRLSFHKNRNRVDIFSSSVVAVNGTRFDEHQSGFNLHGIYASLGSVAGIKNHTFEPHVLWRTRPSAADERGNQGDSDVWTSGLRLFSTRPDGVNYEMELDFQAGHFVQDAHRAFMGMWQVTYAMNTVKLRPRLLGEFTYATGDGRLGDGRTQTFDQLFVRAHRIWGIADHIGGRNSRIVQTGVTLRPERRTQLVVDHLLIWLANPNDGLYRQNGVQIIPPIPGGAKSTYVGSEMDVQLVYRQAANIQYGAGYTHLWHGSFIRDAGRAGSPHMAYLFAEFQIR
jgi:hypothetical protein